MNAGPATALLRSAAMLRTALGTRIVSALDDADVAEVMLNPDGRLWIDRLSGGRQEIGSLTASEAERVVRLVAAHVGRAANAASPLLSAELPETGERFEGVLPPASPAPAFAIRKRAVHRLTLDRYVDDRVITLDQRDVLRQAVRERRNVLIAGGTSSGKTTLANALLAEVADTGDRVLVLEDTVELQCTARDQVCLRAVSSVVTMKDLVRSTLRLRPDRIVVGEVRGAEALDLVKAWGTGHPGGIATIHAGSCRGALLRLEQLILEVALAAPRPLIAEAVNLVVFLAGRGCERRVKEMAWVTGYDHQGYGLKTIGAPLADTRTHHQGAHR